MTSSEKTRYCPMCEGSFDTEFAPSHYGITHRQDAACLNSECRSLERHRLLWLYLQNNIINSGDNLSVLEIGPTRSLKNAFDKFPNINYVGLDLTSKRADVRADINNLPFAENSFGLVICYHVLEHVPDPLPSVQELNRVTRINRLAIFQVPLNVNLATTSTISSSSFHEREVLFGQGDHLRIFGLDFPDFLSRGGFDPQCIDYTSRFSEGDQTLMGLKSSYLIGPKDTPYTTSENFYIATKIRNIQDEQSRLKK